MSIKARIVIYNLIILFITLALMGISAFVAFLFLSSGYGVDVFPHILKFSSSIENALTMEIIYFARNYIFIVAIIFTAILIFGNIALIYKLNVKIISPLGELTKAAQNMQNHDLDTEITVHGDQEVNALSLALEEMRKRLKNSVNTQIIYDENRKDLVANISHDLKTPITSIKGYVEGVLDGIADTEEKKEKYLKIIYSKAEDMEKMVEDLFLFSKLDLNKLIFNFERVMISQLLRNTVNDLTPELNGKNMEISFVCNVRENIEVMADREKLKRVFVNIIENSVKYKREGIGKILITLDSAENKIYIEFADNGQGIKPEDLPKVFERFYRSDISRNSEKKGSGLGFSIAKQIIDEHEGKIWIKSEYQQGTSVFILIPKADTGGEPI